MDKSKLVKDKTGAVIIMDKIRYLYQRYEEREYQGLKYHRYNLSTIIQRRLRVK